jgi:hypothetical protein
MQTHTKNPLLTDTNRRFPFVKHVLWISNNIRFLCIALLLFSFGWLPLLFYERILNYIYIEAPYLLFSILNYLLIMIAKLHSNTNGNSHTIRSVLFIIMFAYANCYWNADCLAFRFSTRKSLLKSWLWLK